MGRKMGVETIQTSGQLDHAMNLIDDELRMGGMVPVGVSWGPDAGHKILLTGTDRVNSVAGPCINPWGREERMTRSEPR